MNDECEYWREKLRKKKNKTQNMDVRAQCTFDAYVINDDFIRYAIQLLNPYNSKLIGSTVDRILHVLMTLLRRRWRLLLRSTTARSLVIGTSNLAKCCGFLNFMCDTNQAKIDYIRHGSQMSRNQASDKSYSADHH